MSVCRGLDGYTADLWLRQPRWVAELTSGEQVHQDDDRPGAEPASAWLRLKDYLAATGLGVRRLWLQFRSDNVLNCVPDDAEGYFFRRALLAGMAENETYGYYLVGYLQAGVVRVCRVSVPALVPEGYETRDPADPETVGPSLITNPKHD